MEGNKEGFSRYISKRSAKENVGLLTEDTEKTECCSVLPLSLLAGFALGNWWSLRLIGESAERKTSPGRGEGCVRALEILTHALYNELGRGEMLLHSELRGTNLLLHYTAICSWSYSEETPSSF